MFATSLHFARGNFTVWKHPPLCACYAMRLAPQRVSILSFLLRTSSLSPSCILSCCVCMALVPV